MQAASELSPVQNHLLRKAESLAFALVQEPGIDHSKDNGVPEDVYVPVVGFYTELIFGCK